MLQGLSPEPRTEIILQDYTHSDMSQKMMMYSFRHISSGFREANPFHTSIALPYWGLDMDCFSRLYNIGSDVLSLSLS